MIVVVGSTNPTKIAPVRAVFAQYPREFPDVEVISRAVDSGVSDQPKTDDEMYQGAFNRATAALAQVPGAEFGVGIEGGLHQYSYGWLERSLVVMVDRAGRVGVGATGGLVLPPKVMQKILVDGKNLEQAMDELFGTQQIGEGIGMFGLLTKEVVTRAEGVRHGVAFALARFLHPDLYA